MAYRHPFKEAVQLGFNTAKYQTLSALMCLSPYLHIRTSQLAPFLPSVLKLPTTLI